MQPSRLAHRRFQTCGLNVTQPVVSTTSGCGHNRFDRSIRFRLNNYKRSPGADLGTGRIRSAGQQQLPAPLATAPVVYSTR